MRSFVLVLVGLISLVTPSRPSQQTKTADDGNLEKQIANIDAELFDAMWRCDANVCKRMADDELVYTTHHGVALDKKQWLTHFKKSAPPSSKQLRDEIKVRALGDGGVVTGRLTMKLMHPEGVQRIQSRFTNVYARRNGQWKLIVGQNTEVAKPWRDFSKIDGEDAMP